MQSLVVIVAILTVTILLSLVSPKGQARTAVARLRQALAAWQDLNAADAPAAQRAAAYAKLAEAEQTVRALPEKYRALIQQRQTLREMLAEAHARQGADVGGQASPRLGSFDLVSSRRAPSRGDKRRQ